MTFLGFFFNFLRRHSLRDFGSRVAHLDTANRSRDRRGGGSESDHPHRGAFGRISQPGAALRTQTVENTDSAYTGGKMHKLAYARLFAYARRYKYHFRIPTQMLSVRKDENKVPGQLRSNVKI